MSEEQHLYLDSINSPMIQEEMKSYWFDRAKWQKEILPWNKEIWSIIFIKQIHNDYQNPERLETENPGQYNTLIQYQKEIYGELARRKIQNVFVEWLQEGQAGKILEKWKNTVRPQSKDPETRKRLFAHFWWAFIYALERKNVRLHSTESKEIIKKDWSIFWNIFK